MAQRTDIFSLGRLGLTSGEGRRLDLHATLDPLELGGERYTPTPAAVPVRARRLAHDRQRLRAAAALQRRRSRARACAASARRRRRSTSTPARSTSPAAATSCSSPYVDGDDDLDLRAWARDAFALAAARPDRLHARLPRPVPALRGEPQRRSGPRARGRARPALGEAVRDPVRVGTGGGGGGHPLPFPSAMAVPKQKQSHARTAQRRAQHKISAPSLNSCPQCHAPRRPHRVCPNCGFYNGREVAR